MEPELNEHLQDNDDAPAFTIIPGEGEDRGYMAIWLRNTPLGVLDGKVTPGARVSPEDARAIAAQLLYFADLVEQESKT